MAALVFVDAHLLLAARDGRDAVRRSLANDWLRLLWSEERGRTSLQALSDYYDFVVRNLKSSADRDDAWDDVQHYLTWNPQPIDVEVLVGAREAQQRHSLAWSDCLVVSAAQVQGCLLVLSESMDDGAEYGGVVVRSPFTLRIEEERGAYTVPSRGTSRHRGRGRPRRTPRAATAAGD